MSFRPREKDGRVRLHFLKAIRGGGLRPGTFRMWQPDFYTSANGVPYEHYHRVSAMTALIMSGGQFNLHTARRP